MRSMPARGRWTLILFAGIAGLAAGYVGDLGSPIAEQVRHFLDSTGAPLRNVHKLEPLVRLPLVLGLAHLLRRVPLPGAVPWRQARTAFAHPERQPMVAFATLILVALTLATSLAWTGRLAPRGAYDAVPGYWHETAAWLDEHTRGERALIVPGAPFGSQIWGLTRDEPLQALASTPWASRDAVPLVPPGAIRALDSVQRHIADGRPTPGLAATLRGQGIGYVVIRNDLDPETSPSARPVLVHRAIEGSPRAGPGRGVRQRDHPELRGGLHRRLRPAAGVPGGRDLPRGPARRSGRAVRGGRGRRAPGAGRPRGPAAPRRRRAGQHRPRPARRRREPRGSARRRRPRHRHPHRP